MISWAKLTGNPKKNVKSRHCHVFRAFSVTERQQRVSHAISGNLTPPYTLSLDA